MDSLCNKLSKQIQESKKTNVYILYNINKDRTLMNEVLGAKGNDKNSCYNIYDTVRKKRTNIKHTM